MPLSDFLGEQPSAADMRQPFEQYFELVLQNRALARSAHALLYDAVTSQGVAPPADEEEPATYAALAQEVYGIDHVIDELMQALHAGAQGMDIRRRILMLVGPPGSAKSTIATVLKRSLEAYTRTEAGAIYGIAGCPMHEDPLHLLPADARRRLRMELGIAIEGELCPVCRYRLENEWTDIGSVPVERVYFSEQGRVGIATFAPSDPNTQDVSDLVGSMDIVQLQRFGVESHPLAWRFDGTLNVANRGLAELIELLKSKVELQYALLTLAQERQIKAGRFALISADEVLLAHTNEAEYNRFVGDRKNEALQSRMYIVKVPYNLSWSAEVRIYQKLLQEAQTPGHLAPWTLKAAAGWSLLSRYEKVEKYPPALKLKLYDGQFEGEYRPAHLREARQLSPRDGMAGISPRQVINALSQAMVSDPHGCVTPTDALKAMRGSLEHHVGAETPDAKSSLTAAIGEIRSEYDKWAVRTVSQAFIAEFEFAAQSILKRYLDMAEASVREDKLRDPVTNEWVEPDEKYMKSLEDLIGVRDGARKAFREELLVRVAGMLRRGEEFRYDSHPRLKEAIEKRLFADLQGTIRTTVSTKTPDEEQRKKLEGVKAHLVDEQGFCEHCAQAVLDYVGYLLEKGQ